MSRQGIDYSKWDKLDVSSDEEERGVRQPIVTRFDKPQSVTIGEGPNKETSKQGTNAQNGTSVKVAHKSIDVDLWSRNGGVLNEYLWRQDRHSVDALIVLPRYLADADGIVKGKDLSVELVDMGKKLQVKAAQKDGVWRTLGLWELSFEVEDDEEAWMWEIMRVEAKEGEHVFGRRGAARSRALEQGWFGEGDNGNSLIAVGESARKQWNLLAVFLKKKIKIIGMSVWWRSFFKGDPESCEADKARSASAMEGARALQASWDEAHALFRQKIKTKEKIEVPSGFIGTKNYPMAPGENDAHDDDNDNE